MDPFWRGKKELIGALLGESEGARFWLGILTELQSRGVCDILIDCIDGVKGFPDAIGSVFPKIEAQLCIVHMVSKPLKYVGWKERKAVARGLKAGYRFDEMPVTQFI